MNKTRRAQSKCSLTERWLLKYFCSLNIMLTSFWRLFFHGSCLVRCTSVDARMLESRPSTSRLHLASVVSQLHQSAFSLLNAMIIWYDVMDVFSVLLSFRTLLLKCQSCNDSMSTEEEADGNIRKFVFVYTLLPLNTQRLDFSVKTFFFKKRIAMFIQYDTHFVFLTLSVVVRTCFRKPIPLIPCTALLYLGQTNVAMTATTVVAAKAAVKVAAKIAVLISLVIAVII